MNCISRVLVESMHHLPIGLQISIYMPSSARIFDPSSTYSARQSGFRSVAGLMLCTGAPLMTLRMGTATRD